MKHNKKQLEAFSKKVRLIVLLMIVIAIPVAMSLVNKNADNRDMAASKKCIEQCPGKDGVLRNCTPPEADGSSEESLCNVAKRTEMCGGKCYVCPKVGGKWTVTQALECDTSVTPTEPPTGEKLWLNYQVSFGGVNPNSAQCVIDWPLKFIVLGGGESKVYNKVIPQNKFVSGNKLVFIGSLKLTGITKKNGLAVFIKGPQHLQMKYGKNNQTAFYNQAGGKISVTDSEALSPLYDFSGYPMLPGDVVGSYSEAPDNLVNGVDFSYIKTKSLVHESIANGGFLKGDLDGNCQVNSNDVNLLKITLQDRQGQLY